MNFQQRKANNTGKALFGLIMNPNKSIASASAELKTAQRKVDAEEEAYNDSLLAMCGNGEDDMYPHS